MDTKTISWLRLIRSENVTDTVFWMLLKKYHSAYAALEALPYLAKAGGKHGKIKIATEASVLAELHHAQKLSIKYIRANEKNYPKLLKYIPYPPPVISYIGSDRLFKNEGVAIVGSRNPSNAGLQIAISFAEKLGHAGFFTVSGLAKGIDTAAHKGSVKTGTIAVLAGGINYIYPPENKRLYYEIIDNGGAIITEKPFNYKPTSYDFPKRNRIIAGIGAATLVVEARRHSGTLISARLANEYNRIVFAIPQAILNDKAQGNNDLLREGATIALDAEDIISTLLPFSETKITPDTNKKGNIYFIKENDTIMLEPPSLNQSSYKNFNIKEETRAKILANLTYLPVSIENIHHITEIPVIEIEHVILELKIAGRITQTGRNIALIKP